MTPFQVYLLMQADSICNIAGIAAIFSGIAFVITTLARFLCGSDVTEEDAKHQTSDWRSWQASIKLHHWACAIFFPALLLSTFMPDTKTIATMVVLPKITSPAALDTLGTTGKELYGIAREALQGLADRAKPHDQQGKNK
jgi:hypothetical protein